MNNIKTPYQKAIMYYNIYKKLKESDTKPIIISKNGKQFTIPLYLPYLILGQKYQKSLSNNNPKKKNIIFSNINTNYRQNLEPLREQFKNISGKVNLDILRGLQKTIIDDEQQYLNTLPQNILSEVLKINSSSPRKNLASPLQNTSSLTSSSISSSPNSSLSTSPISLTSKIETGSQSNKYQQKEKPKQNNYLNLFSESSLQQKLGKNNINNFSGSFIQEELGKNNFQENISHQRKNLSQVTEERREMASKNTTNNISLGNSQLGKILVSQNNKIEEIQKTTNTLENRLTKIQTLINQSLKATNIDDNSGSKLKKQLMDVVELVMVKKLGQKAANNAAKEALKRQQATQGQINELAEQIKEVKNTVNSIARQSQGTIQGTQGGGKKRSKSKSKKTTKKSRKSSSSRK